MRFRASDIQVRLICCNAINASVQVGMGRGQLSPDILPTDLALPTDMPRVDLDYVRGRMVKLLLTRAPRSHDLWDTRDGRPDIEYQSWARTYPSYEHLLRSVAGVQVFDSDSSPAEPVTQ